VAVRARAQIGLDWIEKKNAPQPFTASLFVLLFTALMVQSSHPVQMCLIPLYESSAPVIAFDSLGTSITATASLMNPVEGVVGLGSSRR